MGKRRNLGRKRLRGASLRKSSISTCGSRTPRPYLSTVRRYALAPSSGARAEKPKAPVPDTDDEGRALYRIGQPSPLILHLSTAVQSMQQAILAAPAATDPRFPWVDRPDYATMNIIKKADPKALTEEAMLRLKGLITGIEAWQRHPYRRTSDPRIRLVWESGNTRLLDYGAPPMGYGPPVLLIPSLINRAYILDLMPGRSLIAALRQSGLHPYLLDWGEPDARSMQYDLSDYARLRLQPAVQIVKSRHEDPLSLVGYCMGGTIAAGLVSKMPDSFAALGLIGAPWDFSRSIWITHAVSSLRRQQQTSDLSRQLLILSEMFGAIPVDLFQMMFAMLDPGLAFRKFRDFAKIDPDSAKAEQFVAVEDWLADGVCLSGPVAQEVLVGWHERNVTAKQRWRFMGQTVRPESITTPTIAFCARSDRIAPPGCAEALPNAIPDAVLERPRSGHVGMVIGRNAHPQLYGPLSQFLLRQYG